MPSQLAEHFGLLINTYEPSTAGKLLVEWMKTDWDMFHHERMDLSRAKDLLAEILDNGEIVRQPFVPSSRYQSDNLDRWERLRSELMYKNRFFPDIQFDAARLARLLSHLPAVDVPATWFRARLQSDGQVILADQMGAPPSRLTSVGRANPPGIPYLYLASTAETAISEIRPQTGEIACVADFTIGQGLRIVDLRNPRRLVSPFLLSSEDEIGPLRSDIAFLERLGEELTRPVVPQGASIDYIPSQYLCEFIKKSGYDGVIYRSSVCDGMNFALFRPATATVGAVSSYEISQVSVQAHKRQQ